MRLVNIYQIYDNRAASMFGPIMTGNNEVAIARELADHTNNKETILGRNPEDFTLVKLGYQDQDTGLIDPLPSREHVLNLTELLRT